MYYLLSKYNCGTFIFKRWEDNANFYNNLSHGKIRLAWRNGTLQCHANLSVETHVFQTAMLGGAYKHYAVLI